jgi:hypothetical protein
LRHFGSHFFRIREVRHDALMQRRGLYYHLANQQLGGAG